MEDVNEASGRKTFPGNLGPGGHDRPSVVNTARKSTPLTSTSGPVPFLKLTAVLKVFQSDRGVTFTLHFESFLTLHSVSGLS